MASDSVGMERFLQNFRKLRKVVNFILRFCDCAIEFSRFLRINFDAIFMLNNRIR